MPEEQVQPDEVPAGRSRHRSPNYPAIGLPEAVDRVGRLYAADRKAGAPLETALKHMGFSGRHGKSMMVVSALKKYGLVEDVAGRIVPTQRAVEILVLPKDDPRRLQALREAALSPEINRELFDKFQDDGFPSDETLASELVAYRGFNPAVVENFVRDFKTTIDFASLTDRIEIPLESGRHSDVGTPSQAAASEQMRAADSLQGRTTVVGLRSETQTAKTPCRRFTWPLSKEITATVEFGGGEVNETHIALLQKYLELAKLAVGMETTEDGSRDQ
jgi:hypothetical protein